MGEQVRRMRMPRRLGAFALLLALYVLAVLLGAVTFPGYRNASGVVDLGHYLVPSLLEMFGERRAEYAWWLGTLPLELFFVVIALATYGLPRWVRWIAWGGLAFEILLVLSARAHYTIDVIGGLFVGYVTHRVSLDLFPDSRPA